MRAIQNTFTSRHLIGCIRIGACVALGVFGLPGCTSDMKMGQGGSVATGSAGDAMDGINKLVPQIREMGPADAIPAKRR